MLSRLLCMVAAFFFVSGVLFAGAFPSWSSHALAGSSGPGRWDVSSADQTDVINSNAGSACTYRVDVDAGGGIVEVIVRDRNGSKVAAKSGQVEPGNSRDFDLDQGFSIEVHYVNHSSSGSYERL